MLDANTKRRIDTARDILVGKVPDPKSQVEQITIAMIYKFMDDLDAEAEELGGQREFFAGDFARYGWAKLVQPSIGGYEMLSLYAEAIERMPENPGIPPLFRSIFNNAYLPYRDPETLRAFLKIIDEFTYDHSERLGDAFEYLLSVLGSQGDAGQFRTPRHIIDFMVEVVDPGKDEVILDPACGTAGFLISSYKHILASNTDAGGNSTLTPDDRGRLADNFKGYDISPDMVRLSLVNMYLHGFVSPSISEYDTLTSEDRWNEFADVILANPPFMSPKGGIRPHNRFSVQSRRSEVLFVDYMAEHLTPSGRAGIIVPEGIIFQSQNAHRQLRKMLIEDYLVAVVSLPAGVFNPYSGVKTSILILDRSLARKSDTIAFFKVENDGYDLGAQRRPIPENDLPQVQSELTEYLRRLQSDAPLDDFQPQMGLVVAKEKLAEDGEYGLSGERYRLVRVQSALKWPLVKLGELCVIERGASPRPIRDYITESSDGANWIKIGDAKPYSKFIGCTAEKITRDGAKKSRLVKPGDLILSNSMSYGRPYIMATEGYIHDGWLLLRDMSSGLDRDYLCSVLGSDQVFEQFKQVATGGVVNNLNSRLVRNVSIPLPPLEVQKEIVAEIEGYQKVIDGARAVVDNYRPQITVDPEWPLAKLGEVCSHGGRITSEVDLELPYIGADSIESHTGNLVKLETAQAKGVRGPVYGFAGECLLYSKIRPYLNKLTVVDLSGYCSSDMYPLVPDNSKVHISYLATYMLSDEFNDRIRHHYERASIPKINRAQLFGAEIPLPPLDTQQAIVAEIEAERALVDANRELVTRFEKKIQNTINRVWAE